MFSAAILWWLSTRIDMADAMRAMVSIDRRYLAAVLALVALDRVIMIYRWVLLLRASGVPITTAKKMVGDIIGSVTCQKRDHAPAPSTLAAS